MEPRRIKEITVLLTALISLIFLTSIAFGQADSEASGRIGKSPQAEDFDKKAMERLREMTPDDVEELDKKLARALTFFYDREYSRALPVFREVSDKVETMDVMFWYATCASRAGEAELAIQKFRQMLDIDPNLHRVRLELASVYFGMERYRDARLEVETVLEAKPPKAVKKNIEKLLAAIDAKTRKLYTNARLTLGIQRDGNVSAGPDKEFVEVPGGGTIGPLTNTQKRLRDWVGVVNFYGNALYDQGKKGSWMWNNTGSLYQTYNIEYPEFDFTQWRLTTGPWLLQGKGVLKLPFGYAENVYEHDHLYDTWDFSPSYEYFFTKNFSLRGTFSYLRDTYEITSPPTEDESGQDNISRILEINPNFYFNNRNDILSFYISDQNLNARERRWTYDGLNLAVSYFKRLDWLNWDMEFYTRLKYTKKDYATPALLWPEAFLRSDKKYNLYVALSRNFFKRYFATVSSNWIDNQSNTELYDFEKYVYGIHIGLKY
jgi:tetratricopeptide (TPR) repeat protein